MNVPYFLEMNARKYPEKTALKTENQFFTYQDINDQANQIANGLVERGIRQDDRVVLFLPNGYYFVVAYFAVLKIGAVVTPINTKLTTSEINYILNDSNANAFLTDESLMEQAKDISFRGLKVTTEQAMRGWDLFDEWLSKQDNVFSSVTTKEDTFTTLLYTSGTTGKPKGVVLTNRNILSVAQMISIEMELGTDAKTLLMMPLSHSAPLHLFFLSTMVVGGTAITRKDFHPLEMLKTVEAESVTHFFGAPVAYLFAAKLLEKENFDLSSMKRWVYGGAPLGAKEVAFVKQRFQTDRLTAVYGLTEGGPSGTLLRPEEHDEKAGSIGKYACLYTELNIVDETGRTVDDEEVGEVVIKGLGVMDRYYEREEATEDVFINGWLRTGDLGKRDKDGYLWVVDRKKDVIVSGGVNIFPFEVEQALLDYPDFEEVAIVGVPHRDWGETVKVFYVAREAVDEKQVHDFFKNRLAHYKMPKIYEKIDVLPRNPTGKVLKHILRGKEEDYVEN